jgi:hypothetical protein
VFFVGRIADPSDIARDGSAIRPTSLAGPSQKMQPADMRATKLLKILQPGHVPSGLVLSTRLGMLVPRRIAHVRKPTGGRDMMWIFLATGVTGMWTAFFLYRWVKHYFGALPFIDARFSPKGGCQDAILRELAGARHEVLVQAYSFTCESITAALVEAKKRGAQVDILLDRSNEQEAYSDLHLLLEQGLAPLIDASHAIAHNKVMIIDKRTIITGSFNFTHQAEHENAENIVVIKGHPELVNSYRQNFLTHKSHSKVPTTKPVSNHHKAA